MRSQRPPSTNGRTRVAVVLEIPTPYRSPLLSRLAAHSGLDLHVYYCARQEPGREWSPQERGYPYTYLRGVQLALPGSSQISLKINPGIWLALKREHYATVVLGGYFQPTMQIALLWCRMSRTPYAIMWESHGMKPRHSWLRRLKNLLVPRIVRGASALLPAGSHAADYLAQLGGGRERMFFMPNTPPLAGFWEQVDRARRAKPPVKARLGLEAKPVILYVGRLIEGKGISVLLEAFGRLRAEGTDATLLIVGEGPERTALERAAAQDSIPDVRFLGHVDYGEIGGVYAAADLFVLPSRVEAWGTVINEALAAGLPVIASRQVGAAGDLVLPDENGLIVTEASVTDLHAALRQLLSHPERLPEMGRRSREIVLAWGDDLCVSSFERAVELATGRSTAAQAWHQP